MFVYFVRHGQSDGNRNGIHHTPETPLSDSGIKQAKTVAKRLKNIHFDLIYASPMARAFQTAKIINEDLKLPIKQWVDLSECSSPSEIRGKKIDDPEVMKIKELIAQNYYKGNWKYSDEETFDELDERTKRILDHFLKHHKNQTVLCVSHSQFIKSVVAKILFGEKLSPEIISEMRKHMFMENTGVTICEYTDNYGWSLNTWSDTTHLK